MRLFISRHPIAARPLTVRFNYTLILHRHHWTGTCRIVRDIIVLPTRSILDPTCFSGSTLYRTKKFSAPWKLVAHQERLVGIRSSTRSFLPAIAYVYYVAGRSTVSHLLQVPSRCAGVYTDRKVLLYDTVYTFALVHIQKLLRTLFLPILNPYYICAGRIKR